MSMVVLMTVVIIAYRRKCVNAYLSAEASAQLGQRRGVDAAIGAATMALGFSQSDEVMAYYSAIQHDLFARLALVRLPPTAEGYLISTVSATPGPRATGLSA